MRTPFIRDILQRLASRLGAEVRFHPDGFVGTIRFGSGAYSLFWDNKFNLNPVSSVKIAQDKFYTSFVLKGSRVPELQKRSCSSGFPPRDMRVPLDAGLRGRMDLRNGWASLCI